MTYKQLNAAYLAAREQTNRLRYTRDREAVKAAVYAEMAAYDALLQEALAFSIETGAHRREEKP